MKHKLITIVLALFIPSMALLLVSCNPPSPPQDSNKVSGTVSNWNQNAATLEAIIVEENGPSTITSGTINAKGEFELTLPETVDTAKLGPIQTCDGVTVKPANARYTSTYYLEASRGNTLLGRVYYASSLVSQEPAQDVIVRGVVWVYVDKDTTVKGSCADVLEGQQSFTVKVNLDTSLTKGWNRVLITLEDSTDTDIVLSIKTATIPNDVTWQFDSSYGLAGFKFRLALWLGLKGLQR
jgi:hypothetical protein